MKIGILKADRVKQKLQEKHGDFDSMFQTMLKKYGFKFIIYELLDDNFPKSSFEAEGWIITGSTYGAYEQENWISKLKKLILQIYKDQVPLAGFCFGHQIIAQALGGKVEKFKQGWNLGVKEYNFENVGRQTITVVHQDQIVKKPESARVLATSSFCKYVALSYGEKVYTTQCHPEFTTNFTKDLFNYKKDVLPENLVKEAKNSLEKKLDKTEFIDSIANFFKNKIATSIK